MHVFIAGVMQAERLDNQIVSQGYRNRITQALQLAIPDVIITDPFALNPGSVDYDTEQARHTFLTMTKKAAEADLLIAYLPQVSMGTAMEMWEAYQAGAYIVAVTPHVHHWAIRFTTNEILPDLDSLEAMIHSGRLHQVMLSRNGRSTIDASPIAD
ncbi:MAG: hypothetical protein H6667_14980 [Ardenticatenaceae bacterium]|nr:hypothetical protein [Ardenticatenaceae bacterium]MCB9444558.1 hypothetical protein [Ardenticatenaceae bacterium]